MRDLYYLIDLGKIQSGKHIDKKEYDLMLTKYNFQDITHEEAEVLIGILKRN